eukprot:3163794-Amphidinium_carterae.1
MSDGCLRLNFAKSTLLHNEHAASASPALLHLRRAVTRRADPACFWAMPSTIYCLQQRPLDLEMVKVAWTLRTHYSHFANMQIDLGWTTCADRIVQHACTHANWNKHRPSMFGSIATESMNE